MENCTIYSHKLEFEKVVQIVQSNLPKAKVTFNDGGKQKSLVATIKGGFFGKTKTLKINYRERQNPSYKLEEIECGLTQNLAGMVNFIQSFPAKNENVRNKFLLKVMAANCEIPFMAEPEMTNEFESVLRKIVKELNGFIFTPPNKLFNKSNGQHFVDKNLGLILDPNGNCEIEDIDVTVDAKYHDEPSENATEEQIEVAKGDGIEQAKLIKTVEDKKIDSLSPKEQHLYQTESLSDQQRANATWRYESLHTLLWALGKMETLKFPSEVCDVRSVVGTIIQPSREDFEASVQLRSEQEILDELDKIYRMHWACVDARIKGEEVTGGINPSVIYERHHSLNWLTTYQDQDWDEVQTNT